MVLRHLTVTLYQEGHVYLVVEVVADLQGFARLNLPLTVLLCPALNTTQPLVAQLLRPLSYCCKPRARLVDRVYLAFAYQIAI